MPETPLHTPVAASEPPRLPPELEEALVDLLAQALVAELMECSKASKTLTPPEATGVSPSGHARTVGDALAPAA